VSEPGCAVRLCLRSSDDPPAPPPADLPPPVDPARSLTHHEPPKVTPESAQFAAFQQAKMQEGLDMQHIHDMMLPSEGATGDPNDPTEDAAGEVKVRQQVRLAERREREHEAKFELDRQLRLAQIENARLRRLANGERVPLHPAVEADADSDAAPDLSLSKPGSQSAERRAVQLAQVLKKRKLLDTISPRRYRSYVQLVQQQKELERHKYD